VLFLEQRGSVLEEFVEEGLAVARKWRTICMGAVSS
jgi:hypothetical protein